MVDKFAGNDDVTFGDVNLGDGGPRGGEGANPGAGGWPTIRYYNKETGVLGKSYDKKTDMSMCDELGPKGETYMQDYVEEAGSTSLCSVTPPDYKGCGDKQKKFIAKMVEKGPEDVQKQVERLTKMKGSKMTADNAAWLGQRLAILKQLSNGEKHDEL